jgi:ribosomal protein L37AE/L43A
MTHPCDCPRCGRDLADEWSVLEGVWKECHYCGYRTPPQAGGSFHVEIRMAKKDAA